MFKLILHGGAGQWDGDSSQKKERMLEVGKHAQSVYLQTKSIVEATLAAVTYMEKEEIFNAGFGSTLTLNGDVECDACVGVLHDNLVRHASVGCLKHVKHPILVAKKLMDVSKHRFLVGDGANLFAQFNDFEKEDLISDFRLAEWKKYQDMIEPRIKEKITVDPLFLKNILAYFQPFGTVGAVATDGTDLVSATSTGGYPLKFPGRLGDSCLFGSGTYVDERAATSCTGYGEYAIDTTLAKRVSENARTSGLDISAKKALKRVTDLYGSNNMALISIDKAGTISVKTNTEKMGFVVVTDDSVTFDFCYHFLLP